MRPEIILFFGMAAVGVSFLDGGSTSALRILMRIAGGICIVWYGVIFCVAKIQAWREKRHPKDPCSDDRTTEIFYCLEEKINGIREAHGTHYPDGSWKYRLLLRKTGIKITYTAQTKTFLIYLLGIKGFLKKCKALQTEFSISENDTTDIVFQKILYAVKKIEHPSPASGGKKEK